ncbi:MAG: BatD family protein [Pseudomonadota bacterium]
MEVKFRMKLMVKLFSTIAMLLFALQAQAKVSAITDRTVLSINESLTLEISLTGSSSGNPDLSVLDKNFSIVSQSQSQQYSIINGKSSKKHLWTIHLLPKNTGELIIPALKVGSESTAPIHLVVQKSTQNTSANGSINTNQDVFIEVFTSPEETIYVQQKIDLKIRIYYRTRLSNLALDSLLIDDVIMEQVGEDKQYNKIINKHTYMVIERHYALFPQKSGFLTIPAIRFEAMQGGSGGFFAQRGRPIYKQSSAIAMEVKKKPDSYTGEYWLPAEDLQVISKHSDLSDIKVGDSITLTDKIIAKGVLGSLIPSINWPKIRDVKSYPDQARNNSQVEKDQIYGLREEKMAIIPIRAGTYQLPDRKISWWDISANQQQEKIIPGIRFQVSAAEKSISLSDQQASQKNSLAPIEQQASSNNVPAEDQQPAQTGFIKKNYKGYKYLQENPWFWAWLGTSLALSILLIISLRYIFKTPVPTKTISKKRDKKHLTQQQLITQIKKSCADKDKTKTMNLLIQWANNNSKTRPFRNLNELCQKLNNPQLEKAILDLDQSLYAPQTGQWQADDLYQALKNYFNQSNKEQTSKKNKSVIKPLNPL